MEKNIIEIQEEVKVGNVILEKGDKVKVLKEMRSGYPHKKEFLNALYNIVVNFTQEMESDDYMWGAYFNEKLGRLLEEARKKL